MSLQRAGAKKAGAPAFRDRTFFTPDRRNPFPDQFELRHRNKHIIPSIGIKHSFG